MVFHAPPNRGKKKTITSPFFVSITVLIKPDVTGTEQRHSLILTGYHRAASADKEDTHE